MARGVAKMAFERCPKPWEKRPQKDGRMTETRLREQICLYGRSLFERGLTPGSSGNISVRLDGGGWLVTPTNASLGFLDPARISRLDTSGRLLFGDAPTKEIPLHAALYETRSIARTIIGKQCRRAAAHHIIRRQRRQCRLRIDLGKHR